MLCLSITLLYDIRKRPTLDLVIYTPLDILYVNLDKLEITGENANEIVYHASDLQDLFLKVEDITVQLSIIQDIIPKDCMLANGCLINNAFTYVLKRNNNRIDTVGHIENFTFKPI